VCGYTASIASGNPFQPSTHAIRMSCTPRFCNSVSTCTRNSLLRSGATHSPKYFLLPFQIHPAPRRSLCSGCAPHRLPSPSARQIHNGYSSFQRPVLPQLHFFQHRIRLRWKSELGGDFDPGRSLRLTLDLPRCHAPRIHRDDLVVEAGPGASSLGHDLGIEAGLTVAAASPVSSSPKSPASFCGFSRARVAPVVAHRIRASRSPDDRSVRLASSFQDGLLVSSLSRPFSPMISLGLL